MFTSIIQWYHISSGSRHLHTKYVGVIPCHKWLETIVVVGNCKLEQVDESRKFTTRLMVPPSYVANVSLKVFSTSTSHTPKNMGMQNNVIDIFFIFFKQ